MCMRASYDLIVTENPPRPSRREPHRRLTLDIPERLHYAMKVRSAMTGVPMVDAIIPVLMAHFAADIERYQRDEA